jgi:epoxide hydrolase A/B
MPCVVLLPAVAGDIRHRQVRVGDVELHVAEQGEGRPVLLLHGFPELWYSWRHQMAALADAGFCAVAPDMRGFGRSSAPEAVEAYDIVELCSDVAGLLDDLGAEKAAIVGHDWGATVAWYFALMHPERTACVAGLSVPIVPNPPAPPVGLMREHLGEDFYIVWFQEPGVADEALARDPRRTLLTPAVWTAAWAADESENPRVPAFMTEEDVAIYVQEYERTGFTGGLNWYRNIDRNRERTLEYDDRKIEMPALFMAGTRDSTMKWMSPEVMDGRVPDLRSELVDGAGHWLQQERPDEVNGALLALLEDAGW